MTNQNATAGSFGNLLDRQESLEEQHQRAHAAQFKALNEMNKREFLMAPQGSVGPTGIEGPVGPIGIRGPSGPITAKELLRQRALNMRHASYQFDVVAGMLPEVLTPEQEAALNFVLSGAQFAL